MKKISLILVLIAILFATLACGSSKPPAAKDVRITSFEASMFKGDPKTIYDEIVEMIPFDKICVERNRGTFEIEGMKLQMGYLRCGGDTGWVNIRHYEYKQ